MKTYLSNAFALSMIPDGATVRTQPVDLPAIINKVRFVSVVGHADTARVFSALLGVEVAHNRVTVALNPGDVLYVGQMVGPRLPEGATELPEGAKIKWVCVQVDAARDRALLEI